MLKRAYIAADPVDAHLVRGYLESNGLPAVVKGDIAWSARGQTPLTDDTAPAVWVEEASLDEARRLIARRGEASGASWSCPRCGERLEGQFTECWNCGTSRNSGDPGA